MKAVTALALAVALNACSAPPAANQQTAAPAPTPTASLKLPPAEPAAPGTPAGLPDDRTPIAEASFAKTSAQGAANTVQTYFALIEAGKYGEAWALWSNGGKASGLIAQRFAASFAQYAEYHAQVGAPAGSKAPPARYMWPSPPSPMVA